MMHSSSLYMLCWASLSGISATHSYSSHSRDLKAHRIATVRRVTSKSRNFGPEGCVSVDQSPKNTCIIRTSCEGRDLSNVQFAFDCLTEAKGRNRHSFGVGAFDDVEEYDTGVVCDDCAEPSVPMAMRGSSPTKLSKALPQKSNLQRTRVAQSSSQSEVSKAVAGQAPENLKATYGPDACISTWRNSTTGSCIMATSCVPTADLTHFKFGLLCVGADKLLTRHLFGEGTFGNNETFDTLIKCNYCYGMSQVDAANQTQLVKVSVPAVAVVPPSEMQTKMAAMEKKVDALEADVAQLKQQVVSGGVVLAPNATTTATPVAVKAYIPVAGLGLGWKKHDSDAAAPPTSDDSVQTGSNEQPDDNEAPDDA